MFCILNLFVFKPLWVTYKKDVLVLNKRHIKINTSFIIAKKYHLFSNLYKIYKLSTLSLQLLCPVCRLVIHFSGSEDDFPSPSLLRGDEDPVISQDVIEIQKKMADLFQKQVDKGGIIDLEAEKNKYLLEISQVKHLIWVSFFSTFAEVCKGFF